jgi:hypothetical protein
MIEPFPLQVIPVDEFERRTAGGLLLPLNAGDGLRIVDCGDHRHLTPGAARQRTQNHGQEVVSGRYLGAASGMAATMLITLAAQAGERAIEEFVNEYSPEAFADLAADISRRIHSERDKLEVVQHSSATAEGHETDMSPDNDEGPVGCKFATYLGMIIDRSHNQTAVNEALEVASETGQTLPIEEVREGARIVSMYLPPSFTVARGALRKARAHAPDRVQFVVLQDSDVPLEQTAMVYDLAGYRSSAKRHADAGIPRFQQTPEIAVDLLSGLMPEFELDRRLLAASGLLLGTASREVISGPDTPHRLRAEIIPPEYRVAA